MFSVRRPPAPFLHENRLDLAGFSRVIRTASLCFLLFPLHKMTPLKLAVNDEDCVELRRTGDHVSDGRWLFVPCMIRLGAYF